MAAKLKAQAWTGRVLSALSALFLIFDGAIKLVNGAPVVDAFARLGIVDSLAGFVGALEIGCVAIYLIPQTAVFGAILLTGFLGGAVALHVRVGDPLFTHDMFGVYVGILMWAGLFLREDRLRELIPWRR